MKIMIVGKSWVLKFYLESKTSYCSRDMMEMVLAWTGVTLIKTSSQIKEFQNVKMCW